MNKEIKFDIFKRNEVMRIIQLSRKYNGKNEKKGHTLEVI